MATAFIEVSLSETNYLRAALIGIRRCISSTLKGHRHKYGLKINDTWSIQIEGACAELAAALAIGHDWEGTVDTFKSGGDIGNDIQVRSSPNHTYSLIVRPDDRDSDCFIFVTGVSPHFRVQGWIWGYEAKTGKFLSQLAPDRPPAYAVRFKDLHDMSESPYG